MFQYFYSTRIIETREAEEEEEPQGTIMNTDGDMKKKHRRKRKTNKKWQKKTVGRGRRGEILEPN